MKLNLKKISKTIHSFIKGDEVYVVGGNGSPLGMVFNLGTTNVCVKRHDNGKVVRVDPKILYRGVEWHEHNVSTQKP